MKQTFAYKFKEENKLMTSLCLSGLISRQQLLEIKEMYDWKVPYHNFLHALKVAEGVLQLPTEQFNIIEIRSLFISALFHDAGHTGTAQDLDEFRSLDMAFQGIMDFEKKYNYSWIDYSIVRKSIIGTVFKNRAINTDRYAVLLADLDVSTVWMSFPEFLYYADFPFSIECWVWIDDWIQDVNFFKFLTSIDKNIFRTEVCRKIFPEWLKNIRKYLSPKKAPLKQLYTFWREHDVEYSDFEKKFHEIMWE